MKLQKKMRKRTLLPKRYNDIVNVAEMFKITADENNHDCTTAKKLVEEHFSIIDECSQHYPESSLRDILCPRSGALWHKWAALDKEQYRQEKKDNHESMGDARECQTKQCMTMQEYGEFVRLQMKQIRQKQFTINESRLIECFMNTLSKLDGDILMYYMTWLIMKLDDFSKEAILPFYEKIKRKEDQMKYYEKEGNKKAEEKCEKELKELDENRINAPLGLEHLLREVSQIYEATIEHAEGKMSNLVLNFPKAVAKLMLNGFPVELLDGDACHISQRWINAILDSLSDLLKNQIPHENDPRIFVLSVLGPQSTGKSTLLNALFGVKFSVSAGRCTRGAFMQLLPAHISLQKSYGVDFFLLIDTEGLRAPEHNRLNLFRHDNELSTFVIGIGNLTLITVSGEIMSDMNNILITAVHAFLRMNQVRLKPHCHIIQQHIAATKDDEKLRIDRFRAKKNLDKMTEAVAKETGLGPEYAHFSDIIKFDCENDVYFFPSLWAGRPPMAHFCTPYIEEAQKLKGSIIKCCSATYSIDSLKAHLNGLWKAIMHEDFVFCFENTLEMASYKKLVVEYGECSWNFQKGIIEWKNNALNILMGCTIEQVDDKYWQLKESLVEIVRELHQTYETILKCFFEEEKNKIALQWQPTMILRLKTLGDNLKSNAYDHCLELYQSRKGWAEAEKKKEKLAVSILKKVQVCGKLGKTEMSEEELKQKFEENWKVWIEELTETIQPIPHPSIAVEVEESAIEYLKKAGIKCHGTCLLKKDLKFGLELKEHHINVCHLEAEMVINHTECLDKAQEYTNQFLNMIDGYLKAKKYSGKNFDPLLAAELLHLFEGFPKCIEYNNVHIFFKDGFYIDLVCSICSHAVEAFEEMARTFRKVYDPIEYIENDMKAYYEKVFIDQYKNVRCEITAAETLCEQLDKPIKEHIIRTVSSCVVDGMRSTFPWIKTKSALLAQILLKLGEELVGESDDAMKHLKQYLTDANGSLQYWIYHFTEDYCNYGKPSHISVIIKDKVRNIILWLKGEAEAVTSISSLQKETFALQDWLKVFHSKVDILNLPLQTLLLIGKSAEGSEFSDVHFFLSEFTSKLEALGKQLVDSIPTLYEKSTLSSHKILFDQVSGCTEQCPFCKAQCNLDENHLMAEGDECHKVKHQTLHRPQCLGKFRWATDDTMMLEVCSSLVASMVTFRSNKTNGEFKPYKNFSDYYPDWSIIADKSLEASLYWKWLLGHYSREIEKLFGYEETKIPKEWTMLKWEDVELRLKKETKN